MSYIIPIIRFITLLAWSIFKCVPVEAAFGCNINLSSFSPAKSIPTKLRNNRLHYHDLSLHHEIRTARTPIKQRNTSLQMSIFDKFLPNRGNDFVKLNRKDSSTYGPGPCVLLINCPKTILDSEYMDMISDGAPIASTSERTVKGKTGVAIQHITSNENDGDVPLLDQTVFDVFTQVTESSMSDKGSAGDTESEVPPCPIPILYFSGISSDEMMQTYDIIAGEIYQETGGIAKAACATLVEPAKDKTLRQVVEEISGDHKDALNMQQA